MTRKHDSSSSQQWFNAWHLAWWIRRLRRGKDIRMPHDEYADTAVWCVPADDAAETGALKSASAAGIIYWMLGWLGFDGRLMQSPYAIAGMTTTLESNKARTHDGWAKVFDLERDGTWADIADYLEANYEQFLPDADCDVFAGLLASGEAVDEWPGPDSLWLQPSRSYTGAVNDRPPSMTVHLAQ